MGRKGGCVSWGLCVFLWVCMMEREEGKRGGGEGKCGDGEEGAGIDGVYCNGEERRGWYARIC